jgi:hypothetical protein
MSAEDIIRKGAAAKALLESSDFNTAIDTVRLDAFKGWANSQPEEKGKREENYYLLQAIERLKDNLKALISSARLEEHKAERAENNKQ